MVVLDGEYDILNMSTERQPFDVVVQIDGALDDKRPLEGILFVKDLEGRTLKSFPRNITFIDSPSENGIRRVVNVTVDLEAGQTYRVSWITSPYRISLPYAEFWATAHPVVDMHVEFLYEQPNMQLQGRAECYRSYDIEGSFDPRRSQSADDFRAYGPFLPYQGMFIAVGSNSVSNTGFL